MSQFDLFLDVAGPIATRKTIGSDARSLDLRREDLERSSLQQQTQVALAKAQFRTVLKIVLQCKQYELAGGEDP